MATPIPIESILHPDLAALVETVGVGTVSGAARSIGISQPALSARLSRLAAATGGKLFSRHGRLLRLTAHGARVHDGALRVLRSCEALGALVSGTAGEASPLRVGTADAVPKIVVRRILAPFVRAGVPVQCREWASEHLEAELAAHRLDMLITDREPINLRSEDLETSQEGSSGIAWFAKPALARRLRGGFPRSLESSALALPAAPGPLRERIDRWLSRNAPRARVAIEAEDRALLHHFAQSETVVVPVAKTTAPVVARQFGLAKVADLAGVSESYYSVRSRWRVPALGGGD